MIVSSARGNFSAKELGCHCCGTIRVHEALLDALEILREKTKPLHVISCSRCLSHNGTINGHETSLHLIDNPKYLTPTIAADINTSSWSDTEKMALYTEARRMGLSMGLKTNSIHVDYRELAGLPQKVFFYGYRPEWLA